MTKSSRLILSNEEKLIQEEKERLRKLRIIQVREISKQNAAQIRTAFKREQEKGIKNLLRKNNLTKSEEKQEGLKQIQHLVESHLEQFGQGHQSAALYDDRTEERIKTNVENKEIAALRGKFALDIRRDERKDKENKENAHIIARQFALEQEKLRAAHIAKLPPVPNEIAEAEKKLNNLNKKSSKMVSFHDANAYSTTRYHMPESCVDKPSPEMMLGFDARKEAVHEEGRLNLIETSQARMNQERMEKARLRGKHALEKEILNENYNNILTELNVLEKADREKRQKELINIPKEIFLPAWQRQQEKNEVQLELEREFEKIYADSNLRPENELPQPVDLKQLEMSQSNFEDAELDLTLVDDTLNKSGMKQVTPLDEVDRSQHSKRSQLQTQTQTAASTAAEVNNLTSVSQQTNTSSKQENVALSKLLDKIRKQRELTSFKTVTTANKEIKTSQAVVEDELEKSSEDSELWSTPNSSMKLNDEPEQNKEENADVHLIQDETNSSDSFKSSVQDEAEVEEEEENTTLDETIRDNQNFLKTSKQMRGIMMSSHNVSSLNEIETNTITAANNNKRRKAVISKNIRIPDAEAGNANSSMVTVPNTATYSIDFSHASRDQMVAGPKELFNKNDAKLAIERKRKELDMQQKELEKKLKELEKKEEDLKKSVEEKPISINVRNQIRKPNSNSHCGGVSSSTGIDSGNDHNYCSDSVDNSTLTSPSTGRRAFSITTNQQNACSADDLKRIEYQQMLLKSASEKQMNKLLHKHDETSSECSNTTSTSNTRIEERKKEILKRFGLSQTLLSKKPPHAPVSVSSVLNNDDKHTVISSADSGFSSSLSQTNRVMSNKQPINLEVEKLNNQINQARVAKQQQQKTQQQNDDDLLAYLSTSNIDKEELLRRLSNGSASSFLSSENTSSRLNEQQLSRLFGLEFFESPDVRDLSVEKLIGWKLNQQQIQNETSLVSSNDTLNDGDEVNNSDDHEDSRDLIVSLLNSRQKASLNEQQAVDLKKQFIQEQLEVVRKKKDQLQQSTQPSRPIALKSKCLIGEMNLHELSTIKEVDTPISERNLKLSSTNKQITNNNNKSLCMNNNFDMSSSIGLSMSCLESSLENVTQLSENNNQNLSQYQHCFKSIKEQTEQSNSTLSETLSSNESSSAHKNNRIKVLANKTNDQNNTTFASNSTSTPMQQASFGQQLLSVNTMRNKQMQLFDASLFDYSSSNTNTNTNTSINNATSPTKLTKSISNLKLTEYGAMIYDELSSNNLSSFNSTAPGLASAVSMNYTTRMNSTKKNVSAFKTESTDNLEMSLVKQKLTGRKSDQNKKWFDILATTEDEECTFTQQSRSLNSTNSYNLIQNPISNSTASLSFYNNINTNNNNNNNNNNTSILSSNSLIQLQSQSDSYSMSSTSLIKQYPIDSSDQSLPPVKAERTLDQYKSPPKKLTPKSSSDTSDGLFDRFIKNYSSTTTQSVQDEPELSFVSYKTVSNPVSPTKKSIHHANSENTSACTNSKLSTASSNDSSLSLIHLQQKQLLKQFANLSPIDLNLNSSTNKKNIKSMSTVDFTLFETKADYSEDNAEEEDDYDDEKSHNITSSLVLFSPEKHEMNQNSMNKSDDNDCISVLSANEIESAMTAVSSFSVNNNNNSSVLQRKLRKHSSTLEPIKDLSNEITNSTDCMHQLENLSLLNEQNNQDSLVSFEHHELTQCTPMSSQLKAQTNSTPMSSRLNDLNESNDMRNYFNNLASSLIASNMEEDMTLLAEQK